MKFFDNFYELIIEVVFVIIAYKKAAGFCGKMMGCL